MRHFHSPDDASGTSPAPAHAVYPPREDTELLLPFARVALGSSLLEIGAGSGRAALEAARAGARVVATDLNPWALASLRLRARAERLALETVRTDLAAGLGRFDRVLANPPYLPTSPGQRDPDPWHNLALDGGPDGCRVLARIVGALPDHLAAGASAFVVVSSLQDAGSLRSIVRVWEALGGRKERVAYRDLEGETLEVWELARAKRSARVSARARPA
ncbi:MAG TPA: HemK2/MTQ2 family protein methyltransferase [Thermoplasmata archaeon]|nr:HemK2/MTQ2 family protein methyltransferase [Thermoplasmata archaeon]